MVSYCNIIKPLNANNNNVMCYSLGAGNANPMNYQIVIFTCPSKFMVMYYIGNPTINVATVSFSTSVSIAFRAIINFVVKF